MPTTFIHTGDAHVDADFHGGPNPATGIDRAWESNRAALDSAVTHALTHDVDAFVHAGDAFKHGRPSAEALMLFVDALRPLALAGIPVVLIDGNHERLRVSTAQRTATTAVGEALARHGEVHVVERTPRLVTTSTGLQVACLPWLSKATVLTRADATNLDPATADRFVVDQALGWLDVMCDEADSSLPLVLASHVTVDDVRLESLAPGAHRGSEIDIAHVFNEPILPRAAIDASPVAYAALSHIHARQKLGDKCHYSGSPNRLTLTDADDPKSVNLVTIDDQGGLAGVQHLPTDARDMHLIDLAAKNAQARFDDLAPDALVAYHLRAGETTLPDDVVKKTSDAGARLIGVKIRRAGVDPAAREDHPVVAESTDPATALETWMKKRDVPDPDPVRELARQIVAEVA